MTSVRIWFDDVLVHPRRGRGRWCWLRAWSDPACWRLLGAIHGRR